MEHKKHPSAKYINFKGKEGKRLTTLKPSDLDTAHLSNTERRDLINAKQSKPTRQVRISFLSKPNNETNNIF